MNRKKKKNHSIVAVFDFDHTITNRDSFLFFLLYTKGFYKSLFGFLYLMPDFIKFLFGKCTRKRIKEKIITYFFYDIPWTEIKKMGQKYAHNRLDQYLKQKALTALAWHQSQGHRCLLVSASFAFYLEPWGSRHRFEKVLASELEVIQEKITGRLRGENCWGPEKKKRLEEYLGSLSGITLYVYGDSQGDKEILAIADFPFFCKYS